MSQINWSYHGETGIDDWHNFFPAAKGKHQSPIGISSHQTKYDSTLPCLKYKYNAGATKSVTNNGHSFNVSVDSNESELCGGPLKYRYKMAGFHAHWGLTEATGSEHTVDGIPYAGEFHLVHWNSDLFNSMEEAMSQQNGIAVLGVFVRVGKEHSQIQSLLRNFQKIRFNGDSCAVEGGFDPSCLLPDNILDYWTYQGSLTTPPCYETVSWIVFKEPIELSSSQLEIFRTLHISAENQQLPGDNDHMVNNYRPTQELNGREVTSTFA
ncbi:carbonic anhydrase 13-like [Saccoglossus kowalevskii]|uniref:carbonic anhydrase n=1 Tax=Saccoglossus kowalevskii TaxID=10224 RepID=A0ABM0M276_SACKO|nr:PREDICTED: carbonic anhydrase 13-like [Saccoglossus kowalevskii]